MKTNKQYFLFIYIFFYDFYCENTFFIDMNTQYIFFETGYQQIRTRARNVYLCPKSVKPQHASAERCIFFVLEVRPRLIVLKRKLHVLNRAAEIERIQKLETTN